MNYEPREPRGEELGTLFVDDVLERLNGEFHKRMEGLGIKVGSAKFIELQAEFFMGIAMLNELYYSDNIKTTIPPSIAFGIMRSEIDHWIKPKF